ncbi:hypothetical protein BGP77_17655 [Saccharospirillum sp. MSK14-1]|uniref:hypothetical protein n=1 Tax=Saccharospirillum sp. MSK14-1 TaxID=1897632 RepID=UPI000D340100|nr:hypothetical protein [Saccharospirillum sp. MSK14-1]PTY38265.1 hypothetical protein BGP77_17655 [Saccharospirillum sp. MSK14-1]
MIVTLTKRCKRTAAPQTNGTYNQIPFKNEKPSRALLEEENYLEEYATNELLWLKRIAKGISTMANRIKKKRAPSPLQ